MLRCFVSICKNKKLCNEENFGGKYTSLWSFEKMDAFPHVREFPIHQITKKSKHLLDSVVWLPSILGKAEHIYNVTNSYWIFN